jgi:RimJ/RimL family protein N-acetyltransferase
MPDERTHTTAGEYRFYRTALRRADASVRAGTDETITWWRPSWTTIPPALIRNPVNWVWWLFHNLHVVRSRAFGVIMILRGGRLVHRTSLFPPFFRFPFMGPGDVQIGDTWTDEAARGRGLAGAAIRAALERAGGRAGFAWYVVEEGNRGSIRVVEKEGFQLIGTGCRRPRLGVRAFGFYVITTPAEESEQARA